MEEEKKSRRVVTDTYALLAIVYDEIGDNARRVFNEKRKGMMQFLVCRSFNIFVGFFLP